MSSERFPEQRGAHSLHNNSYKFVQPRAESTLEDVEDAVIEQPGDFLRFTMIDRELEHLATGTVHAHLQELHRRGRILRPGSQYVHVSSLEEMELWQLRRLMQTCDREQIKLHKIQERIEDRLEQLQELIEEFQGSHGRRLRRERDRLENTLAYYQEKEQQIRNSRKLLEVVFRERIESSREETEISPSPANTNARIPHPIHG